MQISTCLNFTPQPQATLRENLKLEGDTVVDASIKLLGSVGYIEAQSTLTLSGDILIVAGGDLFIEALQSAGSPLNATLVSATGAVLVHTLDPQIRLRVIAWQGAFVPSHLTHQASSLMPPILEKQILGFLPRQNR